MMFKIAAHYKHQKGTVVLGPFDTRDEAEDEKRSLEQDTPDMYRSVEIIDEGGTQAANDPNDS